VTALVSATWLRRTVAVEHRVARRRPLLQDSSGFDFLRVRVPGGTTLVEDINPDSGLYASPAQLTNVNSYRVGVSARARIAAGLPGGQPGSGSMVSS